VAGGGFAAGIGVERVLFSSIEVSSSHTYREGLLPFSVARC
jgi:hypothetical protein